MPGKGKWGFNFASIPTKKYFEKMAKEVLSLYYQLDKYNYSWLLPNNCSDIWLSWIGYYWNAELFESLFCLFSCWIPGHWNFSDFFFCFISHPAHFRVKAVYFMLIGYVFLRGTWSMRFKWILLLFTFSLFLDFHLSMLIFQLRKLKLPMRDDPI